MAADSNAGNKSARFWIVIPVHNGGAHLREAVQSVLSQTRGDWHLRILENGSTDDSAQWLQTLTDERISVDASSELLSIEANWRRITDGPCGEWLTLLSHDDRLDPDYLATMAQLIEQFPNASLYQTQFRLIDEAGNTIRAASRQPERESAAEFLEARLKRERESFGTGYLMRWRDFQKVGGMTSFPGLLFSDDALWIALMRLGFKATSPRECFAYRVHLSSSSAQASWETHLNAIEAYREWLRPIAAQDAPLGEVLQCHRDYFLWHTHQAYAIALTQATRRNRRLNRAEIARFNAVLAQFDASWNLQTGLTRGLALRQAINRFAPARVLYNFIQNQRYGS